MCISVIVFDFDGTLFDTREDIAAAVNYARNQYGLEELTLGEVTQMVGDGVAILAERAFRNTSVEPSSGQELIVRYYSAHPSDYARPYPQVPETLRELNETLTIISNKPAALVEAILEEHKLAHLFDYVAGGDTFERKKPDPMAIDYLLDRYRIGRNSILVVGDHSPDIEMARKAGVRSVYCNFGFFGDDQVGADFKIDSIADLPGLLQMLRAQA
ncbi:MAG: HAD-IA family hydrolase [Acidobacteriota bacterium]|nr:MAG: HAD-IA family hydrolase [Acidobacteriota bacterium]